jgi:hypothetical protein
MSRHVKRKVFLGRVACLLVAILFAAAVSGWAESSRPAPQIVQGASSSPTFAPAATPLSDEAAAGPDKKVDKEKGKKGKKKKKDDSEQEKK